MSYASINTSNIHVSPCRLTFGGTDLGAVEGDVTIDLQMDSADIKVAQLGDTIVDKVNKGVKIMVKAKLLELTSAQLKRLFPSSFLGTNGNYFAANVGDKASGHAQALIIHPLDRADGDLSGDFKIFKAVAMSKSAINYSSDKMTALDVEFEALPDFSVGSQARFAFFGDPSVGLNAATVGAATPGSNTGTGTVTGVSGNNSYTRTETVTATCIHTSTNSGLFKVVGGDGRSLGVATVGTPFVADDQSISFTINDGTPDFALNDSFTFACVAANYI